MICGLPNRITYTSRNEIGVPSGGSRKATSTSSQPSTALAWSRRKRRGSLDSASWIRTRPKLAWERTGSCWTGASSERVKSGAVQQRTRRPARSRRYTLTDRRRWRRTPSRASEQAWARRSALQRKSRRHLSRTARSGGSWSLDP